MAFWFLCIDHSCLISLLFLNVDLRSQDNIHWPPKLHHHSDLMQSVLIPTFCNLNLNITLWTLMISFFILFFSFFLKNSGIFSYLNYIYLFLEWGEGREKDRERNTSVWGCVKYTLISSPPTGDLVRNPGMCLDWESNRQPFDSQPALSPLNYTSQGSFFILYRAVLSPFQSVLTHLSF